jgi:hypothetical protein
MTAIDDGNAINVIGYQLPAKWDVIVLGDSNTAAMGNVVIEPWPRRHLSVLAAGLPGNGVVNVAYAAAMNNWIAGSGAKVVIIYLGINDCVIANEASWLTPAAWAASYAGIVSAALAAGASVVCETYHLPGESIKSLVSTTQLQAYNAQVRTTIHDTFYYDNLTRFAILDTEGSFRSVGSDGLLYTAAQNLLDGEHLTPDTQRLYRKRWWEDTIGRFPL